MKFKIYLLFSSLIFSAGIEAQTFSGPVGNIVDIQCTDFSVSVSGVGTLGVNNFFGSLNFSLTHTYDSDLDIYLITPGGLSIEISTDNGGFGDNYVNTTISPLALSSIALGTAPFTGEFLPEGNLSVLNGISADGIWKLRICDDDNGDDGFLNNWSLSFGTPNTFDDFFIDPSNLTISQGDWALATASILETGATDLTTGEIPSLKVWVGYNTVNTNPSTWTNWYQINFNLDSGNYDQYVASLGVGLGQGTYYYAFRGKFNTDSGYNYGGVGGIWNAATHPSGVLTVGPPSPATNNNCIDAIPLTVNPDYLCLNTTAGTVYGATASAVDGNSCAGVEDDDVWFSFVATQNTHRISLLRVAGSSTDMYHSLWTGSCNSLILVSSSCSDNDTSNPTELIIGNTYYIRVYTKTGTALQNTTFEICVGTLPSPPEMVGLFSPSSVTIESGSAVTVPVYGRIKKVGLTDQIVLRPEAIKAWIGYGTTNTNPSGFTNWFPATYIQKINDGYEYSGNLPTSLPPGNYYYAVRFIFYGVETSSASNYYYGAINSLGDGGAWNGTSYQNGVLTINPAAAPANDLCSGAIPLTVGTSFGTNVQQGSLFGATDFGAISISCNGNAIQVNSGVFYTAVFPSSGGMVIESKPTSLNSLSDTVMSVSVGDCNNLIGMSCDDNNGNGNFSYVYLAGQNPGDTIYISLYKKGSSIPTPTESGFLISAYNVPLGTDQFEYTDVFAYPNPVSNILNLSDSQEISSVELYNIFGQNVKFLKTSATSVQVDMSDLPSGVYLVRAFSNNQFKVIKVIKE